MIRARNWIISSVALGCLIVALSPGPLHLINNPTGWELREQLVYLTGVCAMSLMVLCMIISVRLEPINRTMGGLDKAYIIHKWTGIVATVFVVVHWFIENGAHWLVELGLVANPGELTDGSQYSELEIGLFQSGTVLAEVFFYVFVLLVSIALFNKIPYRFFRRTHKIFPGVFLLLAYHGATAQLKERWLSSPAGTLLLLLLAVGSVAAVIALFQQIGRSRKTKAVIKTIDHKENGIIDIQLTTLGKPFVHKAGQYAFLQFAHSKEPHPFTIASSGDDSYKMRFVIKGLGDFTNTLHDRLKEGQPVRIEGPYGEFKFEDACKTQLWIAGGIGITPFLARLEHLSKGRERHQAIHLWYCTRGDLESQFPSHLKELCEATGVKLHHQNTRNEGRLTATMLKSQLNDFSNVSIWFCGPGAFAQALMKDLKSMGFDLANFHYDSFNMR